jgi:alpha/beta superfamily hydrolase
MTRTLRPSQRVVFPSSLGHSLAGILDLPLEQPKAFALFTHCFTCTKDLKLIVRISRGLAEHGIGVLRYDSTGLGNSAGDFSQSNFSTNRADLRSAVDWMSQNQMAPQFLIGHSFGGAASLSVAEELPSIKAVASIAAPSDTRHLAALLERLNPDIVSRGTGQVTIGTTTHTVSRQMLDDFRSFDLPGHLRQLSKPVILMHSPDDETLGFEHAVRLYQLLTSRQASDPPPCATSLICLEGADHLLTRSPTDLVFIVRLLSAWLDRQLHRLHPRLTDNLTASPVDRSRT